MNARKKTFTVVMGGMVTASLAAVPAVSAAENPFAATALSSGYMVAEADTKAADLPADGKTAEEGKMKDGMCAAGKCGSSMKKKKARVQTEEKAKEGKCSGEKAKEGNCSASK